MKLHFGFVLLLSIFAPLYVWLAYPDSTLSSPLHSVAMLFGLISVGLLTFQFVSGIFHHQGISFSHHGKTGVLCSVIITIHIVIYFLAEKSVTGHTPLHLLIPVFSADELRQNMAFGSIALLLLPAVIIGGIMAGRRSSMWLSLHRLSFVMLAMAIKHSVGGENLMINLGLITFVAAATIIACFIERHQTYKPNKIT